MFFRKLYKRVQKLEAKIQELEDQNKIKVIRSVKYNEEQVKVTVPQDKKYNILK